MKHQEVIYNGTGAGAPVSIAVLEEPAGNVKDILPQSELERKCSNSSNAASSERQQKSYPPYSETQTYLKPA